MAWRSLLLETIHLLRSSVKAVYEESKGTSNTITPRNAPHHFQHIISTHPLTHIFNIPANAPSHTFMDAPFQYTSNYPFPDVADAVADANKYHTTDTLLGLHCGAAGAAKWTISISALTSMLPDILAGPRGKGLTCLSLYPISILSNPIITLSKVPTEPHLVQPKLFSG